jgi:predicted metal-dependent peptidase
MLLKEKPFFGTLILHLRFIEADNDLLKKLIPTMGIDKYGRLFFSPEFVDRLSLEEIESAVCHEVHHAVLRHLERAGNRDQQLWNITADFVINEILKQNNFVLAKDWLYNDKYRDWYAEEVYEDLMKEVENSKNKFGAGQFDVHVYIDVDGQGQPKDDKDKDGQSTPNPNSSPNQSPGQQQQQEGQGEQEQDAPTGYDKDEDKIVPQWDKIMQEAYTYAKQQGKTPLGLERMMEGMAKPRVPWQSIVRRFVQSTLPKDFCLDENSLVLTPSGTVPIKDVNVGDTVIGEQYFNPVETKVTGHILSNITKKYVIYTESGKRIVCSPEHKFLTPEGLYLPARELNIGNILITIEDHDTEEEDI